MDEVTPDIVKVQRPLASNVDEPPWLIYDKPRKHMEFRPVAAVPDHVRLALGSAPKAWFEATWDPECESWRIGRQTAAQPW